MAVVRGCNLPEDRLYDVENHVWFKELDDGNLRIGMTAIAAAMAGQLVAVTPKRVGRSVKPGKSCATVESGKWVGPARSVSGGTVVAINQAVVDKPDIVNQDPYEAGWLVVLEPDDWDAVKGSLTQGAEVAPLYEAKMAADGFDGCG